MIEITHLRKSYQGTLALDDVSFAVETGTICGLLGPNGAGKSTTMNIMTGCLAATSGEVRYDGLEIYANMREVKRAIGYLPEIPPLYPELTVREYLYFVGRAKGLTAAEALASCEQLAGACGLTDVLGRLIRSLSKGYRQRVGIAQALVAGPRYLVLDEPTVGLDPLQIIEIRELIHSLAGTRTVLVSSHILSEIRTLCDRIVMIAHGRVVADDTPDNLERRYSTRRSVIVSALATPDELRTALAGIACAGELVVEAGQEAGTSRATITTCDAGPGAGSNADLRPAVSRALLERGLTLLELSAQRASLEDVFIELAEQDAGAPHTQAAPQAGKDEEARAC